MICVDECTMWMELQVAVSHYVGGGIEPQASTRVSNTHNLWAVSPGPVFSFCTSVLLGSNDCIQALDVAIVSV